jgi:hypothetical protein
MAENAFRWLDDDENFTKREMRHDTVAALIGKAPGRLDPKEMIARMIEVIPSEEGNFRNVFPKFIEEDLKAHQAKMFERRI